MIYSAILLTLGIYLGQEYQVIPSIKILGLTLYNYLETLRQNQNQTQVNAQLNIFSYFKNFFKTN